MLDLHAHTTASDGALSPTALVQRAHGLGVRALAVTDHDTLAGLDEAGKEASRLGMRLVPGIEISATDEDGRAIHVLGYLFDVNHPALDEPIARLRDGRKQRNVQIAERLTELGMPMSIEDVRRRAHGTVGRPHFAAEMIERGYVSSRDEAFDKWLAEGRPAYVVKLVVTPKQAIECLHEAGGVAVLAHPLAYERDPVRLEALVRKLAKQGLDGLEVDYGAYTAGERSLLRCYADRYGLIATGGSDFHREPCPAGPKIPLAVLDRLEAKARDWR